MVRETNKYNRVAAWPQWHRASGIGVGSLSREGL